MSKRTNPKAENLKNWTRSEKFELLRALQEFGSDIEQIDYYISTKSRKEIEQAIEYYKSKALQNPEVIRKRNRRIASKSTAPLTNWASALSDSRSFEELQTDTATALRLIADFEDKPPLVSTDKYDFKSAYQILANALDGKVLPNDIKSKSLVDKCVIDTAYFSTTYKKPTFIKGILSNVTFSESDVYLPPELGESPEEMNLSYLIQQREYNPLNLTFNDIHQKLK
ncbi:unnamed protein product [Leptosia nina]|uniref:Myb-like domain-containing protein n=1 Tax=Leptosia nina TaxID=320188 RepID=A0AAV1JXP2_9NEOP